MAVNIIIRTMIAIFAIGIVMMIFMPIVYNLAYQNSAWDNMPTELIANRDNLYSFFLLIPLLGIGGIILWSYMASTRKSVDEFE